MPPQCMAAPPATTSSKSFPQAVRRRRCSAHGAPAPPGWGGIPPEHSGVSHRGTGSAMVETCWGITPGISPTTLW